jgi:hypothetical protein
MLRPKASKSGSLGIPRSTEAAQLPNTNIEHSQDSKASLESSSRSDKTDVSRETSQRNETQRLLEATKEIVNLMHKDYRGLARRSPPIHNQEPWH